jgi:hypothetical protein
MANPNQGIDNILRQVVTYNESNLALLLNSFAFIAKTNKKFKNFNDNIPMNLGSTVSFDLPPRFRTENSLKVDAFQPAIQRVAQLTVDQQANTSYDFSAQQFIFNVRDYLDKFGRAAVAELGSQIESDVAGVAESQTFRFYGNGVDQISSYLQLATALARFRNFGAARNDTMGFLSDLTYPAIVNSGLAQFALARNNKEAMSWEVGRFSNCDWYQSNLLKTHISGNVGENGTVLTVKSVTPAADGSVTEITFSGAGASDADAVKKFDKFQFVDGVSGFRDMRFLTFVGHKVSQEPVQFCAVADAASDAAGDVVVRFVPTAAEIGQGVGDFPPLNALQSPNQNINQQIKIGMQVTALPSHRCGLIMAGNPLFLGMPKLPEEVPFPTSVAQDPDSGASIRQYYGSLFGANTRGMVHDCIWGKVLVPEYAMMVALPL